MSDKEIDLETAEQTDVEKAIAVETELREKGENTEIQIQEKINEVVTDDEEEVFDKTLETKKPKIKRERTEKQKAAFAKARETRAKNIAQKKAEKEANKPPRGRPKKEPEPESSEEEVEEEIVYKKKPKQQPKKIKKVQKVVYVSDDSDESDDEEFIKQIQNNIKKNSQKLKDYGIKEEPTPQYYQPTSMNEYYRFV